MRDPIEVANDIIDLVPEKYKQRFKDSAKDFRYKAPEIWGDCFNILFTHVSSVIYIETENAKCIPEKEWHFSMCSILSGKSIEDLKAIYKGM